MKGSHIRETHDQRSPHPKRPRGLIQNPENFFYVFQNLIGDDYVERFVLQRNNIPLNINAVNDNAFLFEVVGVRRVNFDGVKAGLRRNRPSDVEIDAGAGADIENRGVRSGSLEKGPDLLAAPVQRFINQLRFLPASWPNIFPARPSTHRCSCSWTVV
jgi:hypothetical protein